VADANNTIGFGAANNPALVAIFTYHNREGEQAGKTDFQTQGIAYSLDNGDSWTKYKDSSEIRSTKVRDFRDPKVFWNEKEVLWTTLLAAGDHLQMLKPTFIEVADIIGLSGFEVTDNLVKHIRKQSFRRSEVIDLQIK
jgi:fructan beta-fructosidase